MIIAVHTTIPPHPPRTPSNAASDQPLMLPKQQHQDYGQQQQQQERQKQQYQQPQNNWVVP